MRYFLVQFYGEPGTSLRHIFGVSEVCPVEIISVAFSILIIVVLVTVVDETFLGPASCPAKVHCTAVYALRNGKFSRLGGNSPPYSPKASSLR